MPELHRRPIKSEVTSAYDWGELSVSFRNQRHRLEVLREQILLKEAEAKKRGLAIPFHEERDLSLGAGEAEPEMDPQLLQDREVTIARLSGYLESLTKALEQGRIKRLVDTPAVLSSREQDEHWLYELLARAQEFFPEALLAIKPGMMAETAPFPLEELVKQIHGDQKLLPAERRHLDEVILAVRLRWDRLVRGHLKLAGEKHFVKREAARHLLQDTELWRIIFREKVLDPVFKKIPAEILAEAAVEAFVAVDFTSPQVREAILSSLSEQTVEPLRKSWEVSPELFERMVQYFLDKAEALTRAYEMISRITHPESFQRVVATPEFIKRLREDLDQIGLAKEKEKLYRA